MADKVKKKAKQAEEDIQDVEFEEVSGLTKLENFVSENRNLVYGLLGGVAVILLGFIGYRYVQDSKVTEGNNELFPAIYYHESDSVQRALNGDNTNLGLLDISDDYSGTPVADQADYLAGINFLKSGDVLSAIEYLEKVPNSENLLTMSKYLALGFAHQQDGDLEAAAKSFERAGNYPSKNEATTPMCWMLAAQTYEQLGDKEAARELYETIQEDYPESSEAADLERYLGRVSE